MKWLVFCLFLVSSECGVIKNNLDGDKASNTELSGFITKNIYIANSTNILEALYTAAMKLNNTNKEKLTTGENDDSNSDTSEINSNNLSSEFSNLFLRNFTITLNGTVVPIKEYLPNVNCTRTPTDLNTEDDGNACGKIEYSKATTSLFIGDSCPSGTDRADDGTCVSVE